MSTTSRIGNYTIIRQLGAGGMAQIFEARDMQSGQLVALKLQGDASISIEDLRRFRREADVLRSMAHPNIIKVFDVGNEGGRPYIAVELIQGGSIESVLQKRGAFPPKEAMRIMVAILDGLAHAHARNLVHRDIKPANVLLRPDGTPVLADFDLARPPRPSANARITAEGERLGTPAYMAPEQIRGDILGPHTDLYACGVMLFEMLTGRLPFEGDLTQIIAGHLQKQPPSVRLHTPQAAPDLDLLIGRLLAKRSRDRPESAEAVRLALLDIQAGRPTAILQPRPAPPAPAVVPSTPAARTPPPSAPWVGRLARIIIGLYASMFVLALVIFQLQKPSDPVNSLVPTIVLPTVASTSVPSPKPTTVEVDPTETPATPTSEAEPTVTPQALQRATVEPTNIGLPEGIDTTAVALEDLGAPPMVLLTVIEDTDGGVFSVGGLSLSPPTNETSATVYGELRNDNDQPYEITQLTARFAGDTRAAPSTSLVLAQPILLPGEATAFSISVPVQDSEQTQPLEGLQFSIRSKPAEDVSVPSFSIKSIFVLQRVEEGAPAYRVITTLGRRGDGNLANLHVLLIFYDEEQRVRGFNRIQLDNISALVASDEQIDMMATIQPAIPGVVAYRAVVQ